MKSKRKPKALPTQLRDGCSHPFSLQGVFAPNSRAEFSVYRSLREALPIIDAAIGKLIRLTGGFTVTCKNPAAQNGLQAFLRTMPCGRGQQGADSFLSAYLDSLLTYGRAVGELVPQSGHLRAVLWGDVTQLEIKQGDSPLDVTLCGYGTNGLLEPLPYQNLLLFTTLNPEAAHPYGVSLLRSMPFLADILLKIYHTIGKNWERAGNVRYAVVYKPSGDVLDKAYAAQRSEQMAQEWSAAMQESKSGSVRDFVAVGDVSVKVIGADGPILDSEIPVRQLLEQLVSKTGLPPFLLGLSWSSTERMSGQQADLLTSELWALRRTVQPALEKICTAWLRLEGFADTPQIVWDDISLQDLTEEAHAALYRAQTEQILLANGKE